MKIILFITIKILLLQSSPSDSLLQKGIHLKNNNQYKDAIEILKQVVKKDNKNADAYYHLGDCHFQLNTIGDRLRAENYLSKALKLDTENPLYLVTMGKIKRRQGYHSKARNYFNKAIELDDENFDAYYNLGEMYYQDGLYYSDMFSSTRALREFGKKRQIGAIECFEKALHIKPEDPEVYYKLTTCYLKSNNLKKMHFLLNKTIELDPGNKDALLLLGYTLKRMQKDAEALKFFKKAELLMSEEERFIFNDIVPLLPPNRSEKIKKIQTDKSYEYLSSAFWTSRDPSFMTEYNERLLEHYCRIALSNFYFKTLEKGTEGWKSDKSKVLIRYGEPRSQYKIRSQIDIPKNIIFGGGQDHPQALKISVNSREYWHYKGFFIDFKGDRFYQPITSTRFSSIPRYYEIVYTVPETYESEYEKKRVPVYAYSAEFKHPDGKTAVELYYGMPENDIYSRTLTGMEKIKIKEGIFLFDTLWTKTGSNISYSTVKVDTTNAAYKRSIFQSELNFVTMPGSYKLAFEFEDEHRNIFGSRRGNMNITDFNTDEIALSDLVLGLESPENSNVPLRFLEYHFCPVPSRTFKTGEKIKLYFEVYNLIFNRRNQTGFELTTGITFDKNRSTLYKRALATLNKLVGREKKIEMSITTKFSGTSVNDIVFQTLDVSSLLPGFYILKIQIKDLNSGKIAFRERGIKLF